VHPLHHPLRPGWLEREDAPLVEEEVRPEIFFALLGLLSLVILVALGIVAYVRAMFEMWREGAWLWFLGFAALGGFATGFVGYGVLT
jgi:hypothetical protein